MISCLEGKRKKEKEKRKRKNKKKQQTFTGSGHSAPTMEFSAFGFCSALHATLGTTFSASFGTDSGLIREFLGLLSAGSSPVLFSPCHQVCRRPLGAVWQGSPSQRWAAGGSPAVGPCSTSTAPRSWRVSVAGGWGSKSRGCRGWGQGMLSTGLARASAC